MATPPVSNRRQAIFGRLHREPMRTIPQPGGRIHLPTAISPSRRSASGSRRTAPASGTTASTPGRPPRATRPEQHQLGRPRPSRDRERRRSGGRSMRPSARVSNRCGRGHTRARPFEADPPLCATVFAAIATRSHAFHVGLRQSTSGRRRSRPVPGRPWTVRGCLRPVRHRLSPMQHGFSPMQHRFHLARTVFGRARTGFGRVHIDWS